MLRARRIEEHSLVRDRERLRQHARGSMKLELDIAGNATLRRELPPEEYFESLAARLRPLVLTSESICYKWVLSAITTVVYGNNPDRAKELAKGEVKALRNAWGAADVERRESAPLFTLQYANTVTGEVTPTVTDMQLAAGWLYSDLVHVDPKAYNKDATRYPLKERYAAAVGLFSRLALLVLETKYLIDKLCAEGMIELSPACRSEAVTVPDAVLVDEATVYVAPPGTTMPELTAELPAEWSKLKLGDLMAEQDPSRRGKVLLDKGEGDVQEFEGVMVRRTQNGNRADIDLLVAGGCIFQISLTSDDEGHIVDGDVKSRAQKLTNSIALQIEQFYADLAVAESATVELNGQSLGRLSTRQTDEAADHHRQIVDVLSDIVAIEALLGKDLPVLDGEITAGQRVELRRQRLIFEGKVVADTWGPIITTTEAEGEPRATRVEPRSTKVANIEFQSPAVIVANVDATSEFIGRTDDGRFKYRIIPPPGQRLLTWDTERAKVRQGYLGVGVALWGLEGITEGSLPI